MTGDRSERFDIGALKAELVAAGAVFKGRECRCIFHEDHRASAGVFTDKQGVARFKCQSCGVTGDLYDIRARIRGVPLADILPKSGDNARNHENRRATLPATPRTPGRTYQRLTEIASHAGGRHVATYEYGPDFAVVRVIMADGAKSFRQVHRESDGWAFGAIAKPWPLYRAAEFGSLETPILYLEGEKDVDSAWRIGIEATTHPGGAGKSAHADLSPLAGREVVVLGDNDPAGIACSQERAGRALKAGAAHVSIVDVAALGWPPKSDLTDFLERHAEDSTEAKRRAVLEIMRNAKPLIPSAMLHDLIESAIDGTRRAIALPWPRLSKLTRALLPGCITLIVGPPGSGKSFFLLQAAYALHAAGVPVSVFELEEDKAHHLHRTLAQLEDDARLLDLEWIATNPEAARNALAKHQAELDAFTGCLFDAPDKQPALADLARWVAERAAAGDRVIGIDPLSVADMGGEPWRTAPAFITEVSAIVRKHGASLVLSYHPKKGATENDLVSLDGIAGAASFTRLVQTVIWLQRHAEDHLATIGGMTGPQNIESNRTVHILKTRNVPGQGLRLAFHFDAETLRFSELGIAESERKRKGA